MARLLVTDDRGERILMDEQIQQVHLEDEHSSLQVIERLAWAVEDAEGGLEVGPVPYRRRRRNLQVA